jgi:dephospho-CoA kinase
LDSKKELNRSKLAEHVFSNPKDLKKLNILSHPQVIFDCLGFIEKHKQSKNIVVLDVPLLFESRMGNLADHTILVASSPQKTFGRAKSRGLSPQLARKILSTQWPVDKKKKLADFFIQNNGSLKELDQKVTQILKTIKQKGA